jgi:hypothetical protein
MKKAIKFYTPEELKELEPFIVNREKPTMKRLEDFCTRTNRKYHSVCVYIYTKRKRVKNTNETVKKVVKAPKAELAPTVKDQSVVNIGKGEFNIPIKSWTITQHTDGFYFNVKF